MKILSLFSKKTPEPIVVRPRPTDFSKPMIVLEPTVSKTNVREENEVSNS